MILKRKNYSLGSAWHMTKNVVGGAIMGGG